MGGKTAATWHGVDCNGECCKNPHGVCHHRHVCAYHLGAGHTRDERLFEQAYTWRGVTRPDVEQVDRSTVQARASKAAAWTPYRAALTDVQEQRAEREHAEHLAQVESMTALIAKRTALT